MIAADDFQIEAKTWLRRSTFKSIYAIAEQRGTTVGSILSELADHAIERPASKRRYQRMTPDRLDRYRTLHEQGMSFTDIASDLGVSRQTLINHRDQLRRQR